MDDVSALHVPAVHRLAVGSGDFAPTQKPTAMVREFAAWAFRDGGDARHIHHVKEGLVGFV